MQYEIKKIEIEPIEKYYKVYKYHVWIGSNRGTGHTLEQAIKDAILLVHSRE